MGWGLPGFLAMSAKEEVFFGSFLVSLVPTTFHSSGEDVPEWLTLVILLLLLFEIGDGDFSGFEI